MSKRENERFRERERERESTNYTKPTGNTIPYHVNVTKTLHAAYKTYHVNWYPTCTRGNDRVG